MIKLDAQYRHVVQKVSIPSSTTPIVGLLSPPSIREQHQDLGSCHIVKQPPIPAVAASQNGYTRESSIRAPAQSWAFSNAPLLQPHTASLKPFSLTFQASSSSQPSTSQQPLGVDDVETSIQKKRDSHHTNLIYETCKNLISGPSNVVAKILNFEWVPNCGYVPY